MARITIENVREMKDRGEPIAMVTAYDATFARLIEGAGADMLLVGDSLGMVVQGLDTTLPVTMDQMTYHTAAVVRGSTRALVVADLPFMAYQASVADAMRNAGRLLSEGGCQAVKLEGAGPMVDTVRAMVSAGIPVMGHLGLTPQSVNQLSGFKVQGRHPEAGDALITSARMLQDAGAFGIVLEMIPAPLAQRVTEAISIPTIGIGAGAQCDGQVLVCYDMLGLNEGFQPKFLKHFGELGDQVREATAQYVREVKSRAYPDDDHSFR